MTHPIVGDHYRHYKGGEYVIIGLATHTESDDTLVIYQSTDPSKPKLWARPVSVFLAVVQTQIGEQPRFTHIPTIDKPSET